MVLQKEFWESFITFYQLLQSGGEKSWILLSHFIGL